MKKSDDVGISTGKTHFIYFARRFLLHQEEAAVGGKRPRGSQERAPVHVQFEPKDNDEMAHLQLPSNFAISFE